MDRITARNIAIISPMRQNFAALSKAGEFAAAIIAKYSGTESFPFNGEALVYFNALNRTLEGEKALRSSVSYTLKLLIIRRLVLDGKVADPTVTKQFLSSLSEQVERNMLWLRMTDGNAYTRLSKTIEFIDKTEDLTENIITSEITEDLRSFRYSSVDLTELEQRFFGEQSESYAYSGNHIYNMLTKLVYRKEEVHNGREVSPSATSFGQNLSNYAETAINTGDTDYSYTTENLTYKTENEISENTDIQNEQNAQNVQNIHNIRSVRQMIESNSADASVPAAVTNNTTINSGTTTEIYKENVINIDGSETVSKTIVNTGDTDHSFSDETVVPAANDVAGSSAAAAKPVAETLINSTSYDAADISPESIVNAGDENYSYTTENLTHKTENETSQNSDIRNEQSTLNVQNTQNIRHIGESADAAASGSHKSVLFIDPGIIDSPVIIPERPEVTGDERYNAERSTYRSDSVTSEVKPESTANKSGSGFADSDRSSEQKPTVGETLKAGFARFFGRLRTIFRSGGNNAAVPADSEKTEHGQNVSVYNGDTNNGFNEETDIYNAQTAASENINAPDLQNIGDVQPISENISSDSDFSAGNSGITDITEITSETLVNGGSLEEISETVVNTGDENYSYTTENLTYRTETEVSENTDIRNEQSAQNIQNIRNDQQITENTDIAVSAPTAVTSITPVTYSTTSETSPETVVNIGGSETISETAVNAGDENYSYTTETAASAPVAVTNNTAVNSGTTTDAVSETVVNASSYDTTDISAESIVNAGDDNYSYTTENLTYKTENEISENTDIRNEQNAQNVQNAQDIQNIRSVQQIIESNSTDASVSASVTQDSVNSSAISETVVNIDGSEAHSETVVNAEAENYSYSTETVVSTPVAVTNNTAVNSGTTTDAVSETVVNASSYDTTDISAESIVNAGDENYSYTTENLTYRTETEVSENTDIRNGQSAQNIQNIRNNQQITENADIAVSALTSVTPNTVNSSSISETVVNIDGSEARSEAVVNAGDENYSYTTENLTYKTEAEVSENTDIRNIHQTAGNTETVISAAAPVTGAVAADSDMSRADQQTTVNPGVTDLFSELQQPERRPTLREWLISGIRRLFRRGGSDVQPVTSNAPTSDTHTATIVDLKTFIEKGIGDPSGHNNNSTYNTTVEAPKNTDIPDEQSVQNIPKEQSTHETVNIRQTDDPAACVTISSKIAELSPETLINITEAESAKNVVNIGDENYSYTTESLTYKTEAGVSGNTDIRNEQNTHETVNIRQTVDSDAGVTVSSEITEVVRDTDMNTAGSSDAGYSTSTADSAAITSSGRSTETYTVTGDTAQSRITESLTYRPDTELTVNTDVRNERSVQNVHNISVNTDGDRIDAVSPITAKNAAEKATPELAKAGDLENIGLLVMNTFLSAGSEYISALKDKYIHRRITLTPVTVQLNELSAPGLLNSPRSSFGVITYAIALLTGKEGKDTAEREIYEKSVLTVYLGNHRTPGGNVTEMLSKMSPAEKTKVLSLVVRQLVGRSSANYNTPETVAARAGTDDVRDNGKTVLPDISPLKSEAAESINIAYSSDNAEKVPQNTAPDTAQPIVIKPVFKVTEPEIRLLRLLSQDRYYHTVDMIGAAEEDETIASELKKLYFGIPDRVTAERLLMSRVEKAAGIPLMVTSQPAGAHSRNDTMLLYRDNGDILYYTGGDHVAGDADTAHSRDTVSVSEDRVYNSINTINMPENREAIRVGTGVSRIRPMRVLAYYDGRITNNEYITNAAGDTVTVSPVMRKPNSTRETVRRILERIARYEKIIDTAANRVNAARRAQPAKSSVPVFFDRNRRGTGDESGSAVNTAAYSSAGYSTSTASTAVGRSSDTYEYYDSSINYLFTNTVSEYELPLVLTPQNAVSENIRMLPVYALDGVIIPARSGNITLSTRKVLKKNATAADHLIVAHKKPMMLYRSNRMLIKENAANIIAGYEAAGAEGQTPLSMLPLMRSTSEMRYRDTEIVPASPPREVQPQRPEMSQAELERRFGNLIEGADAGLTYSMNPARHGIDEAMATIEEAVEKVEANSKLIDEIREKQRAIESVALRSTDIDRISEDTIRKLRGQLRLDRSRFS